MTKLLKGDITTFICKINLESESAVKTKITVLCFHPMQVSRAHIRVVSHMRCSLITVS